MLIRKHKTNDPFQIVSDKNIIIIRRPLGKTLGFFSTYKRSRFIHINSNLEEPMQRFVCAHELGHIELHPGINTPFLKLHTFFSTNRIEREANIFAVELLMPDEIVKEYQTVCNAAKACGIPIELAKYKMYQY